MFTLKHKNSIFSRIFASFLAVSLIVTPNLSYAASLFDVSKLPVPGTTVFTSQAFVPVLLKGMTLHPEDPLKFDFIIDSGNTQFDAEKLKEESQRLVKYFLASMTIPKDDLWVNLSPEESDKVIPEELAKTELGRDMLAQDYLLKQLSASLLYPEKELGEKFWKTIYAEAQKRFGTTEVPVNTFNKVWIIPEKAVVYEHDNTVYIVESKLKVMLDSDYTIWQKNKDNLALGLDQTTEDAESDQAKLSAQIVREIIIPEIEKEVNQGENFAPLRQIYHSLILAKWYKETVKETLLSKVYVDQNKVSGIEVPDETFKDKIYNRYIDAYKQGVFNYIKEDYDQLKQEVIPRKYLSGGIMDSNIPINRAANSLSVQRSVVGEISQLNIRLEPQGKPGVSSPILDFRNNSVKDMATRLKEMDELGRSGKSEAVNQLSSLLYDPAPSIRAQAVLVLEKYFSDKEILGTILIEKLINSEKDESILKRIVALLVKVRNGDSVKLLSSIADRIETHPDSRKEIYKFLGEMGDRQAVPYLKRIIQGLFNDEHRMEALNAMHQLDPIQARALAKRIAVSKSSESTAMREFASKFIQSQKTQVSSSPIGEEEADNLLRKLNTKDDLIISEYLAGFLFEHQQKKLNFKSLSQAKEVTNVLLELIGKLSRGRVYLQIDELLMALEDPFSYEALIEALEHPNLVIQSTAISYLGSKGDVSAAQLLMDKLRQTYGLSMREIIVIALGSIGNPIATETLMAQFDRQPSLETLEVAIVEALGKIGDMRALNFIIQKLAHENKYVRAAVVDVLGQWRNLATLQFLKNMLNDPSLYVRASVVRALGELGDPTVIQPIVDMRNTLRSTREEQALRELIDKVLTQITFKTENKNKKLEASASSPVDLNQAAAYAHSIIMDSNPLQTAREWVNLQLIKELSEFAVDHPIFVSIIGYTLFQMVRGTSVLVRLIVSDYKERIQRKIYYKIKEMLIIKVEEKLNTPPLSEYHNLFSTKYYYKSSILDNSIIAVDKAIELLELGYDFRINITIDIVGTHDEYELIYSGGADQSLDQYRKTTVEDYGPVLEGVYPGNKIEDLENGTAYKNKIEEILKLIQLEKLRKMRSSSPISDKENTSQIQNPGGIDLNEIPVKRQGERIKASFESMPYAELFNAPITGFTPVIINIQPIPSLLPLLGLKEEASTEQFSAL